MRTDPWHIHLPEKQLSCKEVLELSVQLAILAPSTHNSQPWEVTIGDNYVIIHDTEVRLPHSDPELVYHWISLGCFIENFAVSASYYGYRMSISRKKHDIELILKKDEAVRDDDNLIKQIPRRYSEKRVFRSGPFPNMEISSKGYGQTAIELFTDEKVIKEAAHFQYESAKKFKDNTFFARELSSWLSVSKRRRTGMHHQSSGLTLPQLALGKAALAITAKPLAKMAEKYLKMVEQSNAVGFITSKNTDADSLINAGRTLEYVSLLVTKYNLSLTPLAAMVEDEAGSAFLKRIANITPTDRPVMFFRICDRKEPVYHTTRKPYKMIVRK